ncbi:Uma2 family endonuclease [Leptothermofonsia sichuanensis]|uniref:Uma2 family endonuclease n=1 Tax=Leptothermofonsia sichuanensis TaxID=2917832 RepID=UPI001EEF9CA8
MINSTANPIAELLPDDSIPFPPDDLWSDEPPLESDLHRDQIDLLIRLIRWWFREGGPAGRTDAYVAGNLTVYYSPDQKKSEFFRGPDVFVVLGTDSHPRRSWTVWHEGGKYPNVIVELLSDSTATIDRGEKKELYQSVWRVPEYFWFDPITLEFQGFYLVQGDYQPIQPNPQGWLWSRELGCYLGIADRILRLFTSSGQRLPLPEEEAQQRAEQAEQRAEQAEQRAEQAEQRAEQAEQALQKEREQRQQLLAKLRSLSPEQWKELGDGN